MKIVALTGVAAGLLFFATTLPAYAQKEGEKHEEKQSSPARPEQQHAQQPQQRAQQERP